MLPIEQLENLVRESDSFDVTDSRVGEVCRQQLPAILAAWKAERMAMAANPYRACAEIAYTKGVRDAAEKCDQHRQALNAESERAVDHRNDDAISRTVGGSIALSKVSDAILALLDGKGAGK